jgi:hypothetical protein
MSICVVYLLREQKAVAPFFESYELHPAGMKHQLLVLDKGQRATASLKPDWLTASMSDRGMGLRAFSLACRKFARQFDYLCCLNSWSVIQSDDWLAKLYSGIQTPGGGIAGATGSWESFYTNQPTWLGRQLFPPAPNYHIRTTGFIMRGEVMRRVWPRFSLTKKFEYLSELGKNGVTQKIMRLGWQPYVIGANGIVYSKEQWLASNTFRSGNQENLLIGDNHTVQYEQAETKKRQWLTTLTYGTKTHPMIS